MEINAWDSAQSTEPHLPGNTFLKKSYKSTHRIVANKINLGKTGKKVNHKQSKWSCNKRCISPKEVFATFLALIPLKQ